MDIVDQLATPAIWTPDMNDSDWEKALDQMLLRSQAATDFVEGRLPPSDFAEILACDGYNPNDLFDHWLGGFTLL